jgi:putative nucleotidyltransferase with HDIG domain/PAS domain S-box-containing protein
MIRERNLMGMNYKTETERHASEERNRFLLDYFPEAIVLLKGQRIVYINPAGVKLLGASTMHQIVGKMITDFVPHDKSLNLLYGFLEINQGKREVAPCNYPLFRLDGVSIFVEMRLTPINMGGKDLILSVIQDRTNGIQRENVLKAFVVLSETLRMTETSEEIFNEETDVNFVQSVLALAKALEVRDIYTAGHGQKMACLAGITMRVLGGSKENIDVVQLAAILHDIGKIGVPDEILRKKGPPTEKEWQIMRQHPDIGAEIVSPVQKLEKVVPIIRSHHEMYNGTGYPQGLKGENIPLAARVVAVVDAYCAMTEDRIYRKARSPRQAVEELTRYAGKQFDPQIVDVFIRIEALSPCCGDKDFEDLAVYPPIGDMEVVHINQTQLLRPGLTA